jgi:type VI secretion system protein ImpA
MALRDELLTPIAGPNPGGVELRYDPLFDKIKEARREDDDVPQGEWQTTRKIADWPLVISLAKDAIATKSKDLQVAAWLTEALTRREGFAGLRSGLDVVGGMIDQHWPHLYPAIEDGDTEMRAGPLEWIGLKLELPVRLVPLDKAGHNSLALRDARTIPTESAAAETSEKAAAREAAIADRKPTPEEIETGFNATPKLWYKALVADIEGCLESLKALDTISQSRFGTASPNYSRLSGTLEEVLRTAKAQLKRKLEIDPDPVEASSGTEGDQSPAGVNAGAGGARSGGGFAAEPTSREDAAARIVGAARYLRQTDPFNPAPYLLLRGFRWGELRASGKHPDPKLLDAPATNIRTNLKGLLLDGRWPNLLEAAEVVMGTPQGRGWLDLQRYALTACNALGSDYNAVDTAMRGALRALLTDLPQLVDMTLMDDTPTANAETRAWLRNDLGIEAATETATEDAATSGDDGEPRVRDPFAQANAEARAGRADRAINLLMREAAREKTSRGRFLYQSHLARIMVDAGHEGVAMPLLEQLLTDIETHKLEEWEAGELVAAPMALLFRCLEKMESDPGVRHALYLRICKLDPLQAISFSQPQ